LGPTTEHFVPLTFGTTNLNFLVFTFLEATKNKLKALEITVDVSATSAFFGMTSLTSVCR